jgi:hypothetical protein
MTTPDEELKTIESILKTFASLNDHYFNREITNALQYLSGEDPRGEDPFSRLDRYFYSSNKIRGIPVEQFSYPINKGKSDTHYRTLYSNRIAFLLISLRINLCEQLLACEEDYWPDSMEHNTRSYLDYIYTWLITHNDLGKILADGMNTLESVLDEKPRTLEPIQAMQIATLIWLLNGALCGLRYFVRPNEMFSMSHLEDLRKDIIDLNKELKLFSE